MVRIARDIDENKIRELKKKMGDESYIAFAVAKLAQALAQEILQLDKEENGIQSQPFKK